MDVDFELPEKLLIEIGFFATDWAVIEQEVVLHASAMASQETDGFPVEYLRLDFKRLREKWFKLANKCLPEKSKEIDLLNQSLARRSVSRGYFLHGIWSVVDRDQYEVSWWEQKTDLQRFYLKASFDEIKEQTDKVRDLRADLVLFVRG